MTVIIISLILAFLLFGSLGQKKKTEYNADFVPASDILSVFNYGYCLDGKRSLSIEESFKNVLILGATGNFKSSGILIPSILKMRGRSSLVINDPSSELLKTTSGALLASGYEIKVINYAVPSEGYNPLKRINTPSDIQKISKMVVKNSLGTGSKDPFWNLASENLISLCTQLIISYTPVEFHSLGNVHLLISTLSYAPERVDKMFLRTGDAVLISEYKSFVAYGDKTLASVIATARTALSIFATDPTVALVSAFDSIDFTELRKKKTAIFINNSVNDMRYYGVITSIFLEQLFAEIMSHIPNKRKDLPVFFLIDEASSLFFPGIQVTLSNIRKHKSSILQIYQSASQITDLYGAPSAKAIVENSWSRVYMAGQPISVAMELETTLGKFEFLDEKNIRHIRPLMTADEIREFDKSIILCGNYRAIKSRTLPFFNHPFLNRLTKLQPYEPKNNIPFEKPSRLHFDAI